MRLAYVSYEYPPDTGGGGIATSVAQTARAMRTRGHDVEVFAGSDRRTETRREDGVLVHRVEVDGRDGFAEAVVGTFAARQRAEAFDLVEGPEYGADARAVRAAFPDLPLVVKLQTPTAVIEAVDREYLSLGRKARRLAARLARRPSLRYDPAADVERAHTLEAEGVVAPSAAMRDRLAELWGLEADRVCVAPHPFRPCGELLEVPPLEARDPGLLVTFLGRLEVRKGVLELAEAVPRVLLEVPDARFRFVGASMPHPDGGDTREKIEWVLGPAREHVEFVDAVPYADVPALLAEAAVCAFPSVWESFGFVCLEAMAAARPVVVTEGTGMADMVDGGRAGRVVPAQDPKALADALVDLLTDPVERSLLGSAARQRVLEAYDPARVAARQERCYEAALARR